MTCSVQCATYDRHAIDDMQPTTCGFRPPGSALPRSGWPRTARGAARSGTNQRSPAADNGTTTETPIQRARTNVQRTLRKYNVLARCALRSMCNVPPGKCALRNMHRHATCMPLREEGRACSGFDRPSFGHTMPGESQKQTASVRKCVWKCFVCPGSIAARSGATVRAATIRHPFAVLTGPPVAHHIGMYVWKRYPLCRMTTTACKVFG